MLANAILIALSYALWFVIDNVSLILEAQDKITPQEGLVYEDVARFGRIVLQQAAFTWILIQF